METIEHHIATANIYQKEANNQIKTLRFTLSGPHQNMLRVESRGRLGEWSNSTMRMLYTHY